MLKFWNYLSVLAENKERFLAKTAVAPLAGAWIEIDYLPRPPWAVMVAPLAGAWIEIQALAVCVLPDLSLPSRERGLKLELESEPDLIGNSRSPRGSVD